MDKAVLWSCEKGGQGGGRPRLDGLGRTELMMAGVMLAGKCCAIAPLFHEGHCITAVGGGGTKQPQENTSMWGENKIFVQSGSQVFHNIEICWWTVALSDHIVRVMYLNWALFCTWVFYKSGRHSNSKTKKKKKKRPAPHWPPPCWLMPVI